MNPVPSPLSVRLANDGSEDVDSASELPSGSVELSGITVEEFSDTDASLIGNSSGALLVLFTVSVNASVSDSIGTPSSVDVTLIG